MESIFQPHEYEMIREVTKILLPAMFLSAFFGVAVATFVYNAIKDFIQILVAIIRKRTKKHCKSEGYPWQA